MEGLVEKVASFCGLDLDANLDPVKLINEYKRDLSKEVGLNLAELHVRNLFKGIGPQSTYDFLMEVAYRHEQMPNPHLLLWQGFTEWVENLSKAHDISNLKFIARDAIPFWLLSRRGKLLWLTRDLFKIADEIAGTKDDEVSLLVRDYLIQEGCEDSWVYADSGCYGTIVEKLSNTFPQCQPGMVVYYFTHSPYISGWLNALFTVGIAKLPEVFTKTKLMEILNDFIEACPKPCEKPSRCIVKDNGLVIPISRPTSPLYMLGSFALYHECTRFKGLQRETDTNDLLNQIEVLFQEWKLAQKGESYRMLPMHSPTWSKAKEFIFKWKHGPCQPMWNLLALGDDLSSEV